MLNARTVKNGAALRSAPAVFGSTALESRSTLNHPIEDSGTVSALGPKFNCNPFSPISRLVLDGFAVPNLTRW